MTPTITHSKEGTRLTRIRTASTAEAVPEIEDSIKAMQEALASMKKKNTERSEEKEATPDDVATSPTRDDFHDDEEDNAAARIWDKFINGEDTDIYETEYIQKVRKVLPLKMAEGLGCTIGKKLLLKRNSFIRTLETNTRELKKRLFKLITIVMTTEVGNALAEYKEKININLKNMKTME